MSHLSVPRRTLLGATALGLAGGITLAAPERRTAAAATGHEDSLGTPITGVTASGVGWTTTAAGHPVAVLIAGGSPSVISAVDGITGALLASRTLALVKQAWNYATAPDRRVYIGTQSSGEVWRFSPDTLTFDRVGHKPFAQTHFWAVAVDDSGVVHFGTYPGGRIVSYDPATSTWTDHGQPVTGALYVRSIASDGRYVYAGTGTVAGIVRLDPRTGESVRIELPAEFADEQFVYDLDVAGGRLFARMSPSNTLLVRDLSAGAWVDRIESVLGLHVSSPGTTIRDGAGRRTEVFYSPAGGPVTGYDLATGERRATELDVAFANRGWAWLPLRLDGFPSNSLVTGSSGGALVAWNPISHQTRSVQSKAAGTPYIIRSLGQGPTGEVYVGGYLSPRGLARVTPETGGTTLLPWSAQVEGMTSHGRDLMLGVYPGAKIYRYETTRDWAAGTNPGTPIEIGHEQDRPVTLTPAGDLTAIGSVPGYGQLGGALTLLDRATGTVEVYRNVAPDQSVVTLLHRDGKIYGGSAIWGGLGIAPTATEAQLFVFDLATRTVEHALVPVPGETSIGGLTFDPDGNLWGMTANQLFRYDVATRQVTLVRRYFDSDVSAEYYTGRSLHWHDGKLVGNTAWRVFEIDPVSLEVQVISTDVNCFALDRLGHWYYGRQSELLRWTPA